MARLTTREIAREAGVSEASIYYHFEDKPALIEAVILDGILAPFQGFTREFPERAAARPVDEALFEFATRLSVFWERILPLLSAVQSDRDLRSSFQKRINSLDLGPHRGVRLVGAYLKGQQDGGRIRDDIDPQQAAMLVCGACYLIGFQKHMLGPEAKRKLPPLRTTVAQVAALLAT